MTNKNGLFILVADPVFSDARGCCACARLEGGNFDLNGDVGNSPEITRYY